MGVLTIAYPIAVFKIEILALANTKTASVKQEAVLCGKKTVEMANLFCVVLLAAAYGA